MTKKITAAVAGLERLSLADREAWLRAQVIELGAETLAEGTRQRLTLQRTDLFELVLVRWGAGSKTAIHGHGGSQCSYIVLAGTVSETLYRPYSTEALVEHSVAQGQTRSLVDVHYYHSMASAQGGVSLHLYVTPLNLFPQFDPVTQGWQLLDGAKL